MRTTATSVCHARSGRTVLCSRLHLGIRKRVRVGAGGSLYTAVVAGRCFPAKAALFAMDAGPTGVGADLVVRQSPVVLLCGCERPGDFGMP